jgi:two-component system nitrogen regulation response regulator GlnG
VDVKDLPPDFREGSIAAAVITWQVALEKEVEAALNRGERNLIDPLTRQFETALIQKALEHTGGRRIEAANLLGWGRNTLTRKIQELGLDDKDDTL